MSESSCPLPADGARRCKPCEGGTEPIDPEEALGRLKERPEWELSADARVIRRTFRLRDFAGAIGFVNAVARIAEREGHHPDIEIFSWNRVALRLTTHAIGGLSENDFILAEAIDALSDGRAAGAAGGGG